ncbi:MAG: hypothetical protein ABSG15_01360 [FCB group bacterium]
MAFFADSANLDDFIPDTITYHADDPSLEFTDDILNVDIFLPQDNTLDILAPKPDKLSKKHFAYDQDSPSLAPEAKKPCQKFYDFQPEAEINYTSDIQIQQIYLLNCSLII